MLFFTAATMGSDYVSIARDIIFNEDSGLTQTVYIPIINDECLENNETFSVTLSSNMSCVEILENEVNITIDDDDSKSKLLQVCTNFSPI